MGNSSKKYNRIPVVLFVLQIQRLNTDMDSITQIALGAAVGEVVLGKKIGNRAMIWGAVAGTIPDLDIIANFFTDDIHSLAIHRGFSHSIVFAIITAPVFGWLVWQLYQRKIDRSKNYKGLITALVGLPVLGLLATTVFMPLIRGEFSGTSIFVLCISGLMFYWLWRYWRRTWSDTGEQATWRDWSWLFFWGVFTHPLLDSLTAYGTQLFLPFTDYRVALNVISVADPLYTIPFVLCLIGVFVLRRNTKRRAIINWLGIGLSSTYMLFCTYNKFRVDNMFEASLAASGIQYSRYMASPLIFNNVLWQGVAEGPDGYYSGVYSINDKRPHVEFTKVDKNHEVLKPYEDTYEIKTLRWFSNGYFNVTEKLDGNYELNDLRYGSMNAFGGEAGEEPKYVFKFNLVKKAGKLVVEEDREAREEARDGGIGDALQLMWDRGKGI